MRLKDKVAIVTGAAAGIGRASSLLFAKEGAKVIAVDLDGTTLDRVAGEIAKAGGECVPVVVDVSQASGVQSVVRMIVEKYGRIDVLFNNAGIVPPGKVDEISEAQWDRAMAINVKSM